jgi:hypothetical protein
MLSSFFLKGGAEELPQFALFGVVLHPHEVACFFFFFLRSESAAEVRGY